MSRFTAHLRPAAAHFTASLHPNTAHFTASFGTLQEDPYTGAYTVTPLAWNETVLPTRGKTMLDDVTVVEIPYWETHSQIEGGMTVYIASTLEG